MSEWAAKAAQVAARSQEVAIGRAWARAQMLTRRLAEASRAGSRRDVAALERELEALLGPASWYERADGA